MNLTDIMVECHEGHKGLERPAWVVLGNTRVRVAEILDRWYEGPREAGREVIHYFKVRLEDDRVFLLRHVPLFDGWALVETGPAGRSAE